MPRAAAAQGEQALRTLALALALAVALILALTLNPSSKLHVLEDARGEVQLVGLTEAR